VTSSACPKTVNNVLTVLNVLLKQAVAWEAIERVPCAIRLLPLPKTSSGFHDFEDYERLVGTAKDIDAETYIIVLLGGEAGLRCGEMIALERRDVNWENGQLCVDRSDWNGQVTSPKGGRHRYVRMTARLAAALREHRSLRSKLVLCQTDGNPLTQQMSHLLLASRHVRGTSASHSRTCRAQRAEHDSTLHAPEPGGARFRDSVAGEPWQQFGNGHGCREEGQ
jgi:integrase